MGSKQGPRGRLVLLLAVVVLVGALLPSRPALAAGPTLSPSSGPPGTQVSFGGRGAPPNMWMTGQGRPPLPATDPGFDGVSRPAWTSQVPGGVLFYAIRFLDSATGYTVGTGGTLLKTTDGAATWTDLTSGTSQTLTSIHLPDPTTGYVVGLSGTILKTADRGATWTAQASGTAQNLFSVYFLSLTSGYAVGNGGTILKTADGGATWSVVASGTTQHLYSVQFVDSNTGFIAGYGGTILKTSDGGATWTSVSSGTTQPLYRLHFPTATTGYAVGNGGTIVKTADGGATWTVLSSGTTLQLRDVYFPTADTGYAVGTGGTILKTTDGGATWAALATGTVQGLYGVHFTSPSTGHVAGMGSIILKTTDGGATWRGAAPGAASRDRSFLSASSSTAALADGQSPVTLTVTLRDDAGLPVAGKTVAITSTRNVGGQIVDNMSAVKDNEDGSYRASVSSATPGYAYLTARDVSDGFLLRGVVLATFAGAVDPTRSSLAASPQTARADGSSPITLALTLVDRLWAPVPGSSAAFASSRNSGGQTVDTISAVVDNRDGTYTATVTSLTPGTATFTATSPGASLTLQASASFYNPVSAAASTLGVKASSCLTCPLASQAAIPADGQSSALLVVGLADSDSHPISGMAVTITSSLNQGGQVVSAIAPVLDRGNGRYAAEVTSRRAGRATFSAVDATAGVTLTQTAEVAFGPAASSSSLAVSPSQAPADGQTPLTITLTLRDGLGSGLPGQSPALTAGPCLPSGGPAPSLSSITDKGDGAYTATARASSACASSLGVIVGGADLGLQALARFAGPGDPWRSSLSLSASSAPADGTTPVTVTVDLRDAARNALAGKVLTLTSSRNSGGTVWDQISPVQDLGNGRYAATVRSAMAGWPCLTLTVAADGVSLPVCVAFTGSVVGAASWVMVHGPVPADGQTLGTISVGLIDRLGSGVSGKQVSIASGRNTVTQTLDLISPVQDVGGGLYTAAATSSTPGFATLTIADVTDGITLRQQPAVGFYASGAALSGTVSDQGGRPLAGTYLTAFGPYGFRSAASTDGSGRYTISALPAADYRLVAAVPLRVTVPGLGEVSRSLNVWYQAPPAGQSAGGAFYGAAASAVAVGQGPTGGIDIRPPALAGLGLPSHVEFPGNAAPGGSLPVARGGGDLRFYASFDAGKESYWAADFTLTYPGGYSATVPMSLADVRPGTAGSATARFAALGPSHPGLVMATVSLKAATPDTSTDQAERNLQLKARHDITDLFWKAVEKGVGAQGSAAVRPSSEGWETFIHGLEWVHLAYEAWEANERVKRLTLNEAMRHWNTTAKWASPSDKVREANTIPQEMIRPLGEHSDPDSIKLMQWLGLRIAYETRNKSGSERFDPGKDGNDFFVNLNNYLKQYADTGPAVGQVPWNLDLTGRVVNIWAHGEGGTPPEEGTPPVASFPILSLVDPSGTVTDASTGQPVAGAAVTLLAQEPSTGAFSLYPTDFIVPAQNPQTTDATGYYGWDVPPGTYQVEVRAQGYRPAVSAPVTVPPAATGVNFALPRGLFLINIPVILKSYSGGW